MPQPQFKELSPGRWWVYFHDPDQNLEVAVFASETESGYNCDIFPRTLDHRVEIHFLPQIVECKYISISKKMILNYTNSIT